MSTRKRYSATLKEMIKRALTEKAGGTFLYVSLVLNDLNTTKVQSLVRKKLQELPLDLNTLYDKILSQIEVDYVEIASSILQWVAIARRPLTVKELAMARLLNSGDWKENTTPSEDLLDEIEDDFKCCGPLVYFDNINNTVNLVHQSAKNYLLGTNLQGKHDLSRYRIVADMANLLIFRTCWTYLSQDDFEQGTMIIDRRGGPHSILINKSLSKKFLENYCFLQYARQEWQEHALAASPTLAADRGFRKDNLGKLPTLRDYWLIVAPAEGQEVVAKRLLEEGAELEARDRWGRTSLSQAALIGYIAIIKLLLEKSAELDARDEDYLTSLSQASSRGYVAIVKLLLEEGVELDARDR